MDSCIPKYNKFNNNVGVNRNSNEHDYVYPFGDEQSFNVLNQLLKRKTYRGNIITTKENKEILNRLSRESEQRVKEIQSEFIEYQKLESQCIQQIKKYENEKEKWKKEKDNLYEEKFKVENKIQNFNQRNQELEEQNKKLKEELELIREEEKKALDKKNHMQQEIEEEKKKFVMVMENIKNQKEKLIKEKNIMKKELKHEKENKNSSQRLTKMYQCIICNNYPSFYIFSCGHLGICDYCLYATPECCPKCGKLIEKLSPIKLENKKEEDD